MIRILRAREPLIKWEARAAGDWGPTVVEWDCLGVTGTTKIQRIWTPDKAIAIASQRAWWRWMSSHTDGSVALFTLLREGPQPWHRLIGKMLDREVAQAGGVTASAVCQRRNKLGIPPFCPRKKSGPRPWEGVLGTVPDAEIARRFKTQASTVTMIRNQLGVPPFPGTAKYGPTRTKPAPTE